MLEQRGRGERTCVQGSKSNLDAWSARVGGKKKVAEDNTGLP